jgi:hypothetical protein
VTTPRWRLRFAALLAGGAFALHQLRYLIGYGNRSHGQLGAQGHSYMTLLGPLVAVALMLVAAEFCARLIDARAARPPGRLPRLRQLWAVATTCLAVAYATQETLEGALSAGHPGGVGAVVGHGGWVALPLAVAFGLAVALIARAGQRAIELAAEAPIRVVRPRPLVSLGSPAAPRRHGARRTTRPPAARGPPLVSTP